MVQRSEKKEKKYKTKKWYLFKMRKSFHEYIVAYIANFNSTNNNTLIFLIRKQIQNYIM